MFLAVACVYYFLILLFIGNQVFFLSTYISKLVTGKKNIFVNVMIELKKIILKKN